MERVNRRRRVARGELLEEGHGVAPTRVKHEISQLAKHAPPIFVAQRLEHPFHVEVRQRVVWVLLVAIEPRKAEANDEQRVVLSQLLECLMDVPWPQVLDRLQLVQKPRDVRRCDSLDR